MRFLRLRLLAGVAAFCWAAPAAAQVPPQRPTPEQARAILQARPEVVQQLRQKLVGSGLTKEQIHARLRAEGYPEDLLDPYLPGGTGIPAAPTSDLYAAIQELGIADSSDVSVFRMLQTDTLPPSVKDSLLRLRDTLYQADSLKRKGPPRKLVIRADVEDSVIRADSGFNVFGLDVFRSTAARVEPNLMGPVDDTYRLGPGDQLVLILTGDVETSLPLSVTREGFVLIPQVGVVAVTNLTLAQLNDVLFTRLQRVYSGVRRGSDATTRFSVTVTRLRTNQIYVMGEVERPGSYMVASSGTALTSLYAAGGPTPNGSLRQVTIRRGSRIVATVDLYDYLVKGDASHDARLETGDIVFVPARGQRVRVIGEVIRPGSYELKPGEMLADMLKAAGGFNSDALQRRVQIERVLPPAQRAGEGRDRVTLDVAGDNLMDGGGQVPLAGGDVIRVLPVSDRIRNRVTIEGTVWSPGPLGLTPGMTIADAIRRAGGLKPDAYLGRVLVSRMRPDSSRIQLRAALRDTTGAVIGDFPLAEDDSISVYSVTDFMTERYVVIGGAVRTGRRFPFHSGMTIRDLLMMAGGLREGAYLKEAEVARLPADRSTTTTATTIRVPLDSTYLFDRREGERYLGAPGLPTVGSGAPDFELQPYDNVLILQQPSWEMQRVVHLVGEIRFPGQYALRTRSERLADLIDRAGGFTTEAYPEGTFFKRRRADVGRVAIDVPEAMRRRQSPENMLLIDGDSIVVPTLSTIVTVRGAVNAPNVVAYVPGKSVRYYVAQAGGAARESDPRRTFVTQPNGKREVTRARWMFPDHVPKPLAGSIVVVPERDPLDRKDYLQIIGVLGPALASLATLYLAIR